MSKPAAKAVRMMADAAGLSVTDDVAVRIAESVGPAFEGFAAIAGTLPLDLEQANFCVVQTAKAGS